MKSPTLPAWLGKLVKAKIAAVTGPIYDKQTYADYDYLVKLHQCELVRIAEIVSRSIGGIPNAVVDESGKTRIVMFVDEKDYMELRAALRGEEQR